MESLLSRLSSRGGRPLNDQLIERTRPGGRIDPASPEAPSRVISRAGCEFLLAISSEGIRAFGSLPRAIFFTAIVAANAQHITRSAVRTWRYAGLDQIPPDSERRPVSILGLSQSLRKPFETTRENVNALQSEGLVVKAEGGVIVPSEVLLSEKFVALDARLWDTFCEMIARLKSLNFDFSVVLGDAAASSAVVVENHFTPSTSTQSPRRLVSRVISEFYLTVAVEAVAPHGDDWVMGQVFIGFIMLNSAAWRLDPKQAWLFSKAESPMPDGLQAPASIAEVARLTGLGEKLVRRKAYELVDAGRLKLTGSRFLVSADYMNGPETRAGAAVIVSAFYRMIYDLTALGVRL